MSEDVARRIEVVVRRGPVADTALDVIVRNMLLAPSAICCGS